MTNEEQRIAIAEACGWVHRPEHDVAFNTPAGKVVPESWRIDYPNGDCEAACFDGLPDYLNDLNAMHEAEKNDCNHNGPHAISYERELRKVCGINPIWHASAQQRAEAFLRTLGLWKD